MGRMISLGFPDSSIPGNLGSIQLYLWSPGALLSAHFDILRAINGGGPFVPRIFGFLLFSALRRGHFILFQFLHCPFLLRILCSVQSEMRRRKGKIGRNLGLGDVFQSSPLVPVGY